MKLGLHTPSDLGLFEDRGYNEDSGMEYELYLSKDGDKFYVSAAHEDVGLETWYEFATYAEAERFAGI